MGRKAHKMILDALAALSAEDQAAAQQVIAADDAVDADFDQIKQMLAQEIAACPANVDAALDLLMVIKYLERIGIMLSTWPSGSSLSVLDATRTKRCSAESNTLNGWWYPTSRFLRAKK